MWTGKKIETDFMDTQCTGEVLKIMWTLASPHVGLHIIFRWVQVDWKNFETDFMDTQCAGEVLKIIWTLANPHVGLQIIFRWSKSIHGNGMKISCCLQHTIQ